MISVVLPLRTVSEANSHTHWRARQKRAKAQRTAAKLLVFRPLVLEMKPKPWTNRIFRSGPSELAYTKSELAYPVIVTITRIAPRELDDDNLAGSQKHVRDGIADALGVDDRDPRVTWRYAQRKGAPKAYAVEVTIEAAA